MDLSSFAARTRKREEELARRPPVEQAREFLRGHLADAETLDEVREDLRQVAQMSVRMLRHDLRALGALLAEPQPEGLLAQMVAWDANWVLDGDDMSDEAAVAFLRRVADLLREVIEAAESQRTAG